jgi:hypothetical protein
MQPNQYFINESTILVEHLPTEIIVINLQTRHCYILPIIAKQIWQMLEKKASLHAIALTIAEFYQHNYLTILIDIMRFIYKLQLEGLISIGNNAKSNSSIPLKTILTSDQHFGWNYHSPEIHRYEENNGFKLIDSNNNYHHSENEFWHNSYKTFLTACTKKNLIEKYYKIAGFTIKLQFLHTAWLNLITPALAHLECASSKFFDLTICIWDSVSTNTPEIVYPWSQQDVSLRGEISGYNTQNIFTIVDVHTQALTMLNRKQNIACYWIRDIHSLPWWVSGSPLQQILHWWMRDRGLQLTHAAAVGYPEGGVILAGRGGSGKSTTALACLTAGMYYVSEDYCFISKLPNPYVYSVYNSAKLEDKSLAFFPELKPQIANKRRQTSDKALIFHHQFQPEKMLVGMPLKAIIVLKVQALPKSRIQKISADAAFPALALSTLWQLTHAGIKSFEHLKKLTMSLPCYYLELGEDIQEIPAIISELTCLQPQQ